MRDRGGDRTDPYGREASTLRLPRWLAGRRIFGRSTSRWRDLALVVLAAVSVGNFWWDIPVLLGPVLLAAGLIFATYPRREPHS